MTKIKIAPSILAADFSNLKDELKRVEAAGADMLHLDVMDGHFVPNITIGPDIVKDIDRISNLALDVHLMIEEPFRFIEDFAKAGADIITFHIEAITKTNPQYRAIKRIKELGLKAGIVLNPPTPLTRIEKLIEKVDMVLVMSVNPGFSGQRFMPSVLPKIKKLRQVFNRDIEVDGGINSQNARLVKDAGADILASGSYIFDSGDYKEAIRRLRI